MIEVYSCGCCGLKEPTAFPMAFGGSPLPLSMTLALAGRTAMETGVLRIMISTPPIQIGRTPIEIRALPISIGASPAGTGMLSILISGAVMEVGVSPTPIGRSPTSTGKVLILIGDPVIRIGEPLTLIATRRLRSAWR